MPFLQKHGKIDSLGFKFNNIAYSSDVVDFYDESFPLLKNLDYWIVDALRHDPHPTHAHLNKTLGSSDIVIGTHSLLGDKIEFNDLGLLIIDEEHLKSFLFQGV